MLTGSWPSFTMRNPKENSPPFVYLTRTAFEPETATGPEAKFAAERGWYRRAKTTMAATVARTATYATRAHARAFHGTTGSYAVTAPEDLRTTLMALRSSPTSFGRECREPKPSV